MALSVPPLMPAKAVRPLPPISNCCTATGVVDSFAVVLGLSASVTWPSRCSSDSAPATCKKPKASSTTLPLARVSSPKLAARSSVISLGLATVPV